MSRRPGAHELNRLPRFCGSSQHFHQLKRAVSEGVSDRLHAIVRDNLANEPDELGDRDRAVGAGGLDASVRSSEN